MRYFFIGLIASTAGTLLIFYLTQTQRVADAQPLKIRGSIPYWDQDQAVHSWKSHVETFDSISLFWYFLTSEGEIQKYRDAKEDTSIIAFAHTNDTRVTAVVTNLPEESGTTWDSGRVANILNNPEKRTVHIQQLVEKLKALSFDGVSIDYESLDGNLRQSFSQYVAELADTAHAKNMFVGVALHPKRGVSSDKQYNFQDWSELAKRADELYIMAYGEHWDTGGAGPIASLPWVQEIVQFAIKQRVPLSKFYLGIPLYGYDWKKDSDDDAQGLTYSDSMSLLAKYVKTPQWDERAQSPYFSYEEDGHVHEVWYENIESITKKIQVAKHAGFGGVTFWRLGGDDPELWEQIKP